jgi:hypothetical protein
MIPKQWFEEQGIAIKEYSKEVTYTVELENGDRKVDLKKSEFSNGNNYLEISFYEQNIVLATYEGDYLENINFLINQWLIFRVEIKDILVANDDIQFTDLYEYYLEFGINAFKIYSWANTLYNMKEYIEYSGEDAYKRMFIVYELCRNSALCYQFRCSGNLNYIALFSGTHPVENSYSIVIQNNNYLVSVKIPIPTFVKGETGFKVEYDEQNQEFPTPHEAVAYLETLLAEHLKNT